MTFAYFSNGLVKNHQLDEFFVVVTIQSWAGEGLPEIELLNFKMSNEKYPGLLGDEILPSYIGIIGSQYKDPVINQPG